MPKQTPVVKNAKGIKLKRPKLSLRAPHVKRIFQGVEQDRLKPFEKRKIF